MANKNFSEDNEFAKWESHEIVAHIDRRRDFIAAVCQIMMDDKGTDPWAVPPIMREVDSHMYDIRRGMETLWKRLKAFEDAEQEKRKVEQQNKKRIVTDKDVAVAKDYYDLVVRRKAEQDAEAQ